MKKLNLLLIAVILLGMASCTQKAQEVHHYLVILSMDGFRWDYPEKVETPNLDAMATNGARAERFIPSFPTTTFASHYTMATGLHPDNHGILVNRFYAPDLDADFNKGDRSTVEDGRFYGGEPIWVTAETQDLKTATFFWVGSEADVQGIRPTYWKRYDHHFPYEQRIDTVIHWLSLPKAERPKLVMWYFDEPDSSGHRYGPDGDSLKPVIARLDSLVGVFRNKMKALPHANQINFIIVSDHGMANLSPDKQIMLDQHVDTAMIALIDGWNPTMNIKVKEGYLDQVYEDLKKVDNLHVWKHGEVPERLHHGTHVRTHDLILVAENGWTINWSWTPYYSNATHGFDNAFEDMHAIFYAEGPDFKSNHSHEPLYTIDLYPLMAHILGLQGAEVDGKFDRVSGMLK
jgi:predicted AlkP superfamily pyrophosphatase or phosphodiesterase